MEPCPDGTYRAEWKPTAAATSCDVCGVGIASMENEQVVASLDDNGNPVTTLVRASEASCCELPARQVTSLCMQHVMLKQLMQTCCSASVHIFITN